MQQTTSPTDLPQSQSLDAVVTQAMQRHGVPGVAVGLLHDGIEQSAGFGVTNVAYPRPVDPDTLFLIASISKTITATAVMRLTERGLLALDRPIRTYLPDFRLADASVAERLTLRHLLTHPGGWQELDRDIDTRPGDDALARLVDRMADQPQVRPLGATWSYSNNGFSLIGRVIEVVTGQTYETAITDLVLAPLGMAHTFLFAADAITYNVAVGHERGARDMVVTRPYTVPRCKTPAGGVIASVRDMVRYARFHLGDGTTPDGERLLTRETLALMQRPQIVGGHAEAEANGLNWYLREVAGIPVIGHEGRTNSQWSTLMMVPTRRFAVVVLTNGGRGYEVLHAVVRWAFGHTLGLPAPPAWDRFIDWVRTSLVG
jgi:CubicO group peptidase (beta-lactamase class C family)